MMMLLDKKGMRMTRERVQSLAVKSVKDLLVWFCRWFHSFRCISLPSLVLFLPASLFFSLLLPSSPCINRQRRRNVHHIKCYGRKSRERSRRRRETGWRRETWVTPAWIVYMMCMMCMNWENIWYRMLFVVLFSGRDAAWWWKWSLRWEESDDMIRKKEEREGKLERERERREGNTERFVCVV